MEEYEKRRERLNAMRMEAAAQAGVNNAPGLPSGGLSNPLIEIETISTTPFQYNPPRFDYYTDPMSAFSGNKRRNDFSPQVPQGHYNMPPRIPYQGMTRIPVHQNPAAKYPVSRSFHAPPTHFNPGPPRSPMEALSPVGRPRWNPPRPWGRPDGNFDYSPPPNMYRGNNLGQGDSSVSYSRGQMHNNSSPHYGSGRGGNWFPDSRRGRGRSAGSGPSSRRGGGSHGSISAELQPGLYYSDEMVDDPWKWLTPVVWKGVAVNAHNHEKSRLPKAVRSVMNRFNASSESSKTSNPQPSLVESITKKAKVSPESSKISKPQPSLAEFLAASFNDSVKEPIDDDEQGS